MKGKIVLWKEIRYKVPTFIYNDISQACKLSQAEVTPDFKHHIYEKIPKIGITMTKKQSEPRQTLMLFSVE